MMELKISLIFSIILAAIAIILRLYSIDYQFFVNLLNNNYLSKTEIKESQLFTKESLSQYDGIKNKELYLSIFGSVYDVTKGDQNYGPGATYHTFTGKDVSRSFVTGDFNAGTARDDVADLTPEELLSLKHWQQFYKEQYTYKGKLIGRYFDSNGNPTQYTKIVQELIQTAEEMKQKQNDDEKLYPPCNIEWDAEHGSRVWCTEMSGGISRNWIGFPRKYFKPGSSTYRCACVQNLSNDPKTKPYENCNSEAVSCYIKT